MNFGRRIRELRRLAGLTVGQLAARTGLSRQWVHAIEGAAGFPRADATAKIAAALGLPHEELLPPNLPTDVADPVRGRPRKVVAK